MAGNDWDDDFEFGEDSDGEAVEVPVEVPAKQEASEVYVPGKSIEHDPYYDEPVSKGAGGSFVIRDGKRYRRRPE